ncbi:MAG: hypothetical protein IJ594_03530 [Oscillospiraceae bacterium]|nr:hypothetical protein [Oscillospiraceae bacterium]
MKKEEYYEKCRALISVLLMDGLGEADKLALIWVLSDMFENLGQAIGTAQMK